MSYYDGLTEKELYFIKTAEQIGKEKGDCLELQALSKEAYSAYQSRSISSVAYGKVYATCCEYAYPR